MSFTGSPEVGKKKLAKPGGPQSSCRAKLELGGKGAAMIF